MHSLSREIKRFLSSGRMVGNPSLTLIFTCWRLLVGRKPSSVRLAGHTPENKFHPCDLEVSLCKNQVRIRTLGDGEIPQRRPRIPRRSGSLRRRFRRHCLDELSSPFGKLQCRIRYQVQVESAQFSVRLCHLAPMVAYSRENRQAARKLTEESGRRDTRNASVPSQSQFRSIARGREILQRHTRLQD
jgi:hypothetical protein